MFGSHFSTEHQTVFAMAAVLVVGSVWAEWRNRTRLALILLTGGAFLLQVFAATLDPFLNQWDECFHALVAKRMLADPFTPRLFAGAVLPTSANWTQAGLWLHKPPFFLWQISASLAVFGVEPWAVRIPSALWLSALVPISYRMGSLLAGHRAGWIASLFTACSYYLLELTAGAVTTDHNDAIFIATVACSWWALLELWNDGHPRWAALAGMFSACAILTKVFVGAVVFLPWFAVVVKSHDRDAWMRLLLGVGIAITMSMLWFGTLAIRFPQELYTQWSFDTGHLGNVVEGHGGDALSHFEVIDRLIPPFTWWLVVPAYALLVWRASGSEHRTFLIVLFVAIHAVFAWADTKMPSFTMVLFPLYMMALGAALVTLIDTIIVERYRSWLLLLVPLALAGYFLNIEVLQHRHTLAPLPKEHQHWRQQQMEAIPVLALLRTMIPDPAHSVVYHLPALHHIQFMFATGVEATDQMPMAKDVEHLLAKGYRVYGVQDGAALDAFPPGVEVISDEVLRFPNLGRPN